MTGSDSSIANRPLSRQVLGVHLEPVDIQFEACRPWRTLANLYRPEQRDLVLALVYFLLKITPVWVLPIVTANIVDVLARPGESGPARLWLNATTGLLCILQNALTNALYVRRLSAAVRNVEVRIRSALVRRLQMLSLGFLGRRDIATLQTKLLRDPRVLILDEATNALDLPSEILVQEALERLARGRTTFVIAHRLSVVRRIDRILVLDRGRIVESGSRAELLARPDSYVSRLQAMTSPAS